MAGLATTFAFNGVQFAFDAVISEVESLVASVTEHDVEAVVGSSSTTVVDHVKRKPRTLALEGFVSGSSIASEDEPTLTPAQVRFQLEWCWENAALITVTTPERTYANMVIESLIVPRNRNTGDSLSFSVLLRQVRFAKLKESYVRVTSVRKAKPKVEQGMKPTEEASPPPLEETNASGKSPLDVGGLGEYAKRQRRLAERRAGRVRGIP